VPAFLRAAYRKISGSLLFYGSRWCYKLVRRGENAFRGRFRDPGIRSLQSALLRIPRLALGQWPGAKCWVCFLARVEHPRSIISFLLVAYSAIDPVADWDADWAEVWEEIGAGQPLPEGHVLAERCADDDQVVLAKFLRVNLARAGE